MTDFIQLQQIVCAQIQVIVPVDIYREALTIMTVQFVEDGKTLTESGTAKQWNQPARVQQLLGRLKQDRQHGIDPIGGGVCCWRGEKRLIATVI